MSLILFFSQACVSLSVSPRKSKQNLACPADCQISQGYKKHQALLCSGDKGLPVQFIHHPHLLWPKWHKRHIKNSLKEKLLWLSILSLLPLTFHPWFSVLPWKTSPVTNVCSPQCLHLFSPFLRLCHPNTDLPRRLTPPLALNQHPRQPWAQWSFCPLWITLSIAQWAEDWCRYKSASSNAPRGQEILYLLTSNWRENL